MAEVIAVCRHCGYQDMFSTEPANPPTKDDKRYAQMKETCTCPSCAATIEFCPVN